MKFTLLIIVSGLLAGCQNLKQPEQASNTELEPLYASLDEAATEYRRALAANEEDAARQALAALFEQADRCSSTPGCEAKRFFQRYSELLEVQTQQASPSMELLGEAEPSAEPAPLLDYAEEPEQSPMVAAPVSDSPILETLPAASQSMNLLNGRELSHVISMNEPVKAAINEWLTWLRPALMDSYENYQYLRNQIWPEYEKASLPEALLFGILAKESGGKAHAVSSAGAAGLLQFMPATGRRFNLGVDATGFDSRFDPKSATRANVAYLNERFRQFNHDLALALAAYNGGEGRIGQLVSKSVQKNFWDQTLHSKLPVETRDYVPMVLAAAWLFLHPEEYGLVFPAIDVRMDTLTLKTDSSLNSLAICLGNYDNRNGWFRALRNLNPRYTSHQIIEAGTSLQVPSALMANYKQRCVAGKSLELARELAHAAKQKPAVQHVKVASYVVRAGDSLDKISRRFSCPNSKSLAKVNGIAAPRYAIRQGQKLQLVGCKG